MNTLLKSVIEEIIARVDAFLDELAKDTSKIEELVEDGFELGKLREVWEQMKEGLLKNGQLPTASDIDLESAKSSDPVEKADKYHDYLSEIIEGIMNDLCDEISAQIWGRTPEISEDNLVL